MKTKKDIQYEAQPDAEADPLETDRKKIGARKGVELEVTAARMKEEHHLQGGNRS